jgi:hypothetical protein
VLEFSKNITVLFEFMPKSPKGERHYQISTGLQKLNRHFANKDISAFTKELENIEENLDELTRLLDEDKKTLIAPMSGYLAKLKDICSKLEGEMNYKVKMTLMVVEDAYIKLNEKLGNAEQKPNENNKSRE